MKHRLAKQTIGHDLGLMNYHCKFLHFQLWSEIKTAEMWFLLRKWLCKVTAQGLSSWNYFDNKPVKFTFFLITSPGKSTLNPKPCLHIIISHINSMFRVKTYFL